MLITGLSEYLREIITSVTSILVGDFNIKILRNSVESHEYLNVFHVNGYVSTINKFTRVDNNSESCLVHIC